VITAFTTSNRGLRKLATKLLRATLALARTGFVFGRQECSGLHSTGDGAVLCRRGYVLGDRSVGLVG
jgi:hypothetical protein